MTDIRIPPYHEHEFYYEPKPQFPIYLRADVVYDVIRTEVIDRGYANGPTFCHYVEEKAERARRLEAIDAELAEVGGPQG